MRSWAEYHLILGISYSELPSKFKIASALGCPVEVDLLLLTKLEHGVIITTSDLSVDVDIERMDQVVLTLIHTMSEWFEKWGDPAIVSTRALHESSAPDVKITRIPLYAREFLGLPMKVSHLD